MQYLGHKAHSYKVYDSFLLRCWQDRVSLRWKFSLEGVTSREEIHFGDISCLIEYLENQFQIEPISHPDRFHYEELGGTNEHDR